MDYLSYKVLHLFAALTLLFALGGLALRALEADSPAKTAARKLGTITHGVALLLLLVSGFGLMAKLGISHTAFPLWIWGKLILWLVFGGITVLIHKQPGLRKPLWWLLPVLAGVASWLAIYRP